MAKCTICDAELPADAVFCPQCGMKANRPGDLAPPPDATGSGGASGGGGRATDADEPLDRLRSYQAAGPGRADTPEEELWQGTYSPKAMATSLFGGVLLSIAAAVGVYLWIGEGLWHKLVWCFGIIAAIWLIIGARLLYRMWSVRYRLTNQRFFHEKGILSRVTDRIEVIDMDDITYVQNVLDRMLGVGTIKITSSDRTDPELTLVGIDGVKEVAAMIDSARRAERIRRGLHIEQI
ncbi:MAG: PH domain-containing protein [Pirellulales bacterium]